MLKRLCLAVALFAVPSLADLPRPKPAETKPAEAKPAEKPAPKKPTAALTVKDGIATPESVFYDAETDTYLISNINGSPLEKDNNGYITELSPDGTVVNAKLVAGGGKVTLNAPKGLVVHGGLIYVADLDTVRLFDRKTGAPKGDVKVVGSTFVNDLAVSPDGKIYVSDSGLKGGKDGFEPTGTDGIYVIEPGKKPKLKTLLKDKALNRPNGLLVTADTLYVAPFGSNEVQVLDLKGKKKGESLKLPKGGLDGIFEAGGKLYVSSWEGSAVYVDTPGGAFTELFSELKSPADIGFDSKRNRVLVPRFMDSFVEAWQLP